MGKNIIICFDGAGKSSFTEYKTNVYKFFDDLAGDKWIQGAKNNKISPNAEQVVYYDSGVGTKFVRDEEKSKSIFARFFYKGLQFVSKSFRMATGYGVAKNRQQAYNFILNHYKEGDKVYLVGFSRGAATARNLSWYIYAYGLKKRAMHMFNKAMHVKCLTQQLKEKLEIESIFIWDTVVSLGVIKKITGIDYEKNRLLSNFTLVPNVKTGYHALSIDEQRDKFVPTLWSDSNKKGHQTIEQVWFAGVHSNVGGGYQDAGLSDVALGWMIDKAKNLEHPIVFKDKLQLQCNSEGKIYDSLNHGVGEILYRKVNRYIKEKAVAHISVKERMDKLNYNPINLPKTVKFVKS